MTAVSAGILDRLGDPGFLFGLLMGCCWVFVAVNAALAVRHTKPGVRRLPFLYYGYRLFDERYFTEAGRRFQTRMGAGFLAFIMIALGGAVVGAMYG